MNIQLTANHKYNVDGRCYPGFTEIARSIGLVNFYNSDPFYLERGSAIHLATELIDRGTLDWSTVDERIEPFLEGYLKFKEETQIKWDHAEESLFHALYQYCGTLDRFLPLYDIKSGQGDIIQLEAYAELLRHNGYDPGRTGYFLQLNSDASYKVIPHKYDRKLLGVWLSSVAVFQYKKQKGLL